MTKVVVFILLFGLLLSCGEENTIPKPPAYLRLELPDHTYAKHKDSCSFSFDLATLYTYENLPADTEGGCKGKIDLGPLNGTIFIHYWKVQQPLSYYINNANNEIDRHKVKANTITDERIIRAESRVYGTRFKLIGDVATPYQFYLTDSTDHFLYAEVLFNSRPNYDSLKPTLDYLELDLDKLLKSFKWE